MVPSVAGQLQVSAAELPNAVAVVKAIAVEQPFVAVVPVVEGRYAAVVPVAADTSVVPFFYYISVVVFFECIAEVGFAAVVYFELVRLIVPAVSAKVEVASGMIAILVAMLVSAFPSTRIPHHN